MVTEVPSPMPFAPLTVAHTDLPPETGGADGSLSPKGRGDATNPAALARRAIRRGEHRGPTTGLAPGYVQANLVVVPADVAPAFEAFCRANPRPCPLLAVSKPGDPRLPDLGDDIDLRTDLPRYRLFRDGAMIGEVPHLETLWRDDLVAFAIGCSFSFEEALLADGLPVRHIALGRNVPMYVTDRDCVAVPPFAGKMVVSMRPMTPAEAERAIAVTGRFSAVHGAPVAVGDPARLGIRDLSRPDFGDAVPIADQEVPVFWACGVTPQMALASARLPFAIAHSPGHMLITDRLNMELADDASASSTVHNREAPTK